MRLAVSIASSRLGRNLRDRVDWFDEFRTRLESAPSNTLFLTVPSTSTFPAMCAAAKLFPHELVELRYDQDLGFDALVEINCDTLKLNEQKTNRLSSRLIKYRSQLETSVSKADLLLFAFSDEVDVISCRPKGNISSLLRCGLTNRLADFRIAESRSLFNADLISEFANLGAEVIRHDSKLKLQSVCLEPIRRFNSADSFPRLSDDIAKDFFIHTTRGASGPFPDQCEADFWNELVAGNCIPNSPFDTLLRIVMQQRLIGQNQLTRSDVPVICFSEADISQFISTPQYRHGLKRWNYLPYGLGIRKSWLMNLGARPVIYGEHSDFRQLAPIDQPFFQRRSGRGGRGTIDWTAEKEWRLLHTLDLRNVRREDMFLFAPTVAECDRLADYSRWPVFLASEYSKAYRNETIS